MYRSRRQAGQECLHSSMHVYASTDNRKHNASDLIYWIGGGMNTTGAAPGMRDQRNDSACDTDKADSELATIMHTCTPHFCSLSFIYQVRTRCRSSHWTWVSAVHDPDLHRCAVYTAHRDHATAQETTREADNRRATR